MVAYSRPLRNLITTKMSAALQNLTIEQGATWSHSFVVYQPAPVDTPIESLVVENLTGYTSRMQVRRTAESPHVLLELTTENSRIVITPLTGRLDLTVSAATTAALNFDTAVYDLEIVNAGEVTKLVRGEVTLVAGVTR